MNTELKTDSRTAQILVVMRILAWVAFIGLMINTGAILTSYVVSCFNPIASGDLYKGLDLRELRAFNFWYYTQSVSFMVAFEASKALVFYLLIKALSAVNLNNPFKVRMVRILEMISYVLVGTWFIAVIYNAYSSWILKTAGVSLEKWATEEFFFVAGLVFVISQVFKRGVELQADSELII